MMKYTIKIHALIKINTDSSKIFRLLANTYFCSCILLIWGLFAKCPLLRLPESLLESRICTQQK